MPRAIHQFLAGYSKGDAISNEARLLQHVFRSWGCESEIFCAARHILPELRKTTPTAESYRPSADSRDILLLHLSIGSVVNDLFARLPARKAILYHNITPPEYFTLINSQTAAELARGRQQLRALAGTTPINLADSQYNADELTAAGYQDPRVLPLVLDLDALTREVDGGVRRRMDDGLTNILFVGRAAPNKRLEDLLDAFAYYQRAVNRNSRLIHVGSHAGTDAYHHLLRARARELRLDHVVFAGPVPQQQLNAYFACADIFLSMSEHEGFCIPLLEAMTHQVPVMAFDAGAVAETMDGAGVLFREKRFDLLAELIGRVATDAPLRAAILAGQARRIQRYRDRDLAGELRLHLAPLLES